MPSKRTTPSAFFHAKELRRNLTPAERKLWTRLRDHRLNGLGFRRQHAIGSFIVDFCCPEKRWTIELDGHTHANQVEYDQSRTQWLNEQGWRELRFTNHDVEHNLEAVLDAIVDAIAHP
jgi:very-short-patch-repair endonuclease